MFESDYNLMLCEKLCSCLPSGNKDIGTRELLKAYACFEKMINGETVTKNTAIFMPFVGDKWKEICADFLSLDFYHFIIRAAFPFVKSPDKLVDILQATGMNTEQSVRTILYLHDLCNENLKNNKSFETNYEKLYR